MKHLTCITLLSASIFMGYSCEKTQEPQLKAERFELTLSEYRTETGETAKRYWKADDEVALMTIAGEKVETSTAYPLMEGRRDGLFMYNLTGLEKGEGIVAFLPSDAPVRYEDGQIKIDAPAVQSGDFKTMFLGQGVSNGSDFMNTPLELESYWHTLRASVSKGKYSISKAEFKSEEQSVTVSFDTPLDCSKASRSFFVTLAPMTLSNGYELVFTTTDNKTFSHSVRETTELGKGMMTELKNMGFPAELIVCGDGKIYIIDADIAIERGFTEAIKWEWDASEAADIVGGDMTRIDECKPVDNGTKILATSSRSWAVLIDIATKDILWWSYSSKSAHSADLLPGGKIAVACSEGTEGSKCNRIQIFNIGENDKEISYVPLESAHGVVYNPDTDRVYAVGGSVLNIYRLTDWQSDTPCLTLEESINTSARVSALHDLTLVDAGTLLLAGKKAALYNLNTQSFTPLPHFNQSSGIKSVNYNPLTGDCWYTDATDEEHKADYDWSTTTIFHTGNVAGNVVDKTIAVPDLNMYKVRVLKW